jgi:hypothetical protein
MSEVARTGVDQQHRVKTQYEQVPDANAAVICLNASFASEFVGQTICVTHELPPKKLLCETLIPPGCGENVCSQNQERFIRAWFICGALFPLSLNAFETQSGNLQCPISKITTPQETSI